MNAARSQAWAPVREGIWVFRDSCNVYAVRGPSGLLIVNAGTGHWLDAPSAIPGTPAALACTHYFRDHSAGAARAAAAGIPVFVPEGELSLFTEPHEHFRQRPNYSIYDNIWDHFAPIAPTAVAGVLPDEERIELAGLPVEVVPLPGVTATQAGLLLTNDDGKRVAFCGETIHSPGRLPRVAPLQYTYNKLPGLPNVIQSSRELRRRDVDELLPSLGVPILEEADSALAELEANLRTLGASRGETELQLLDEPILRQIGDRIWQSTSVTAISTFVLAPSGKAMVIDLGFDFLAASVPAHWTRPHMRRASLRPVHEFLSQTGAEGIDLALASHYHDDHVCSLPLLQRAFDTQVWCADWFADLLSSPEAYAFPCQWPQPTRIDRRLPADETIYWEGIPITVYPMSGHTRFSAAISFVVDDVHYLHCGDQYLSTVAVAEEMSNLSSYRPDWAQEAPAPLYVYRNGFSDSGYIESAELVRRIRPDILLSGHQPPFTVNDAFLDAIDRQGQEIVDVHRAVMPLERDEPHFGIDSWGGWVTPYRIAISEPGSLEAIAHVRNPLPEASELEVRLVGPDGWAGPWVVATAEGHGEVAVTVTMDVPRRCTAQPIAIELIADGQPFGQVAEALVTVRASGRHCGSRHPEA